LSFYKYGFGSLEKNAFFFLENLSPNAHGLDILWPIPISIQKSLTFVEKNIFELIF